MSEKQQRLVLSIIEFLNQSIQDGTVKQDDKEGLEIAIQCIGEAFGVDPNDEEQSNKLSIKPATLQTIFDVFLKTRDKVGSAPPTAGPSSSTPSSKGPSPQDKTKAEQEKQAGNALMSNKKYDEAIASYTRAIDLDPTNGVYYSNRAAAYSSKGDNLEAIADAEKAIEVDPSFIKAYHRLGHAYYCLADYKASATAFRRGLELDPSNVSLKTGLQNAESRIVPDDEDDDDTPPLEGGSGSVGAGAGMPDMAEMLRNMGGGAGGGGAGGMPDIGSLMGNPMLMQMAQQMMQGGGMERLMSNPSVSNMMNRMQSGGGMPSMAEIMNDPQLRDLASQFGAGGGT